MSTRESDPSLLPTGVALVDGLAREQERLALLSQQTHTRLRTSRLQAEGEEESVASTLPMPGVFPVRAASFARIARVASAMRLRFSMLITASAGTLALIAGLTSRDVWRMSLAPLQSAPPEKASEA